MAPQIVLVSGCSSGIGLATAVLLAKDAEKRFKVYATMRNLAKKGQLEEEGNEYVGDTLIIKQMDVCSDESVNKAVQELIHTEGQIDVLFNNAGIAGFYSVLECTPISKAQEMMDVNFFGSLRLIKAALPSMKARQSGHIINCSSVAGIIGFPFFDIYTASKFAVEGLSESLAPMLRQFNIRCTILEPGPVKTSGIQNTAAWVGESIDNTTADQKTQELTRLGFEYHKKNRASKTIESIEVAAIVQDIILGKITNFRCQVNTDHLSWVITSKLKDPACNEPIELIGKQLYGELNEN